MHDIPERGDENENEKKTIGKSVNSVVNDQ